MDIAEEKQAQRTSGKSARRALSPEQRAAANAALCARLWQLDAVQNAQTILLYAAFGGEAGLAGFAAEAARRGKVLAYPVCGENCSLTAAVPGPDGWETGLYGIRTPVLERSVLLEPEQLDLVLVPALPLMQTASGWAWAKATTTATCPAAQKRQKSALHWKFSALHTLPWMSTTSGWTRL